MKKIHFSLLVLMMSLAVILSACGQKNEEQSTDDASTDKAIRVVTNADYAPFESLEGEKVVGFDVDYVNALAKEAGYTKLKLTCWLGSYFVEMEKENSRYGCFGYYDK